VAQGRSTSPALSAFVPIIDLFRQVVEAQPDKSPAVKLHKLEATLASCPVALADAVPLLAVLLAVPLDAHYPPLTLFFGVSFYKNFRPRLDTC
jgi:hypothetical protein